MATQTIAFRKACMKVLSGTEVNPRKSNQHEFNGVAQLEDMFGIDSFDVEAQFAIRGHGIEDTAKVTWYDARRKNPRRSEHRLYFQTNRVMAEAREGDNILIGFDKANTLHCILIPSGASGHRNDATTWQTSENLVI